MTKSQIFCLLWNKNPPPLPPQPQKNLKKEKNAWKRNYGKMATGAMSSLSAHYQRMGKGWFNSKALCLHQPLMFGRLKQQLFHFSVMKVFAPMYTMFIRVLQDGALDLYWKNTHIPFVQNTNGNHINQENCCCQEKKSVGNFVNHCLSNIFLRDEVVGGTNIWCWWPWFGCVHNFGFAGELGLLGLLKFVFALLRFEKLQCHPDDKP